VAEKLAAVLQGWAGKAWGIQVGKAQPAAARKAQIELRRGEQKVRPDQVIDARAANAEGNWDKIFLVVVRRDHVIAWEFDTATLLWSRPASVDHGRRSKLHAASDAVLLAFRSISRIVGATNGSYRLRVRASEIAFGQPRYQPMPPKAVAEICQANAGLIGDGPLAQTFLVVNGRDESFTTATLHTTIDPKQVGASVTDGRWYALEATPGFNKQTVHLTSQGKSVDSSFQLLVRDNDGGALLFSRTVSKDSRIEIPVRSVVGNDRVGLQAIEISAHGFVVARHQAVIGSRSHLKLDASLEREELSLLRDLAEARAVVTEFETRREIATQRIQARIKAKRTAEAKSLLSQTRATEKPIADRIGRRMATLQGTALKQENQAIQKHWKDLSQRWARLFVAKALTDIEDTLGADPN